MGEKEWDAILLDRMSTGEPPVEGDPCPTCRYEYRSKETRDAMRRASIFAEGLLQGVQAMTAAPEFAEASGRAVREVWLSWAAEKVLCGAPVDRSHHAPWEDMPEAERELDRAIGTAVGGLVVGVARLLLAPESSPSPYDSTVPVRARVEAVSRLLRERGFDPSKPEKVLPGRMLAPFGRRG